NVKALKERWLESAGQFEIDLKRKVDAGELEPIALANVIAGKTITGESPPAGSQSGKDMMDNLRMVLDTIAGIEQKLMEGRITANEASANFALGVASFGSGFAVFVGIIIVLVLISKLMGQLGEEPAELRGVAQDVADGNLTVSFSKIVQSTTGTLANSFFNMVTNLKNLLVDISKHSSSTADKSSVLATTLQEVKLLTDTMNNQTESIATASSQASSNMSNIAASTEEMSTSVASVAASIEEMSATSNEISRNCQLESEIAQNANQQSVSTNNIMKELEVSASEIGKVLDVIKDIADQTNLLALNATIEAASAGDAGKGFAVVASEVKELARQTALAIDQIGSQIASMRENTGKSVTAIGEITGIIEEVNSISQTIVSAVEEQSATINEISNNVNSVNLASAEVSSSIQESAAGLTEISTTIAEFSESTSNISAKMGDSEQHVVELSAIADELKASVGVFKV
ncbi:MAG: methyl-accepting chemotaxis protein, partial [Fibrobacterales bacterium]